MKKILIILCCFALTGCALFEDKRVRVIPKVDPNSPEFRKTLRRIWNLRYEQYLEEQLRKSEKE